MLYKLARRITGIYVAAAVGFAVYATSFKGGPFYPPRHIRPDELMIVVGIVVGAVSVLYVLWHTRSVDSETWLDLELRARKAKLRKTLKDLES